jgi:glycosyltransferase involved in cell wall biosynthesis
MISVLIPTYNYNIVPLATALQQQCADAGVVYEIICLDDASADTVLHTKNTEINQLPNSSYSILPKNIGRSAIRNLLAEKAQYNWLLFLDADTLPVDGNLIKNYLLHLNDQIKIVYGGIRYQEAKPEDNQILRWVYGNEREALPVEKRQTNPHLSLLTLNFCIHKDVFKTVRFNESIPNLRHEDTLFSYDLSKANIKVEHIHNPVYHLGLESSEVFLRKSDEAVEGLNNLLDNNLLSAEYIRIAKMYFTLKSKGLLPLVRVWHKMSAPFFRKNLLGSNPNLLIFDLYRLGYLCSLKTT